MEYKPSIFNFILNDKDDIILYNSLYGLKTACKVGRNNIEKVRSILMSSIIESEKNTKDLIISNLIKRGFLIEKDANERKLKEALFTEINSGNMLRLIILPTEQCNFRCKYCYESFKKGTMQPEIQDAIIKYVRKNIHRYSGIRLSWFGGEPLLALDVIERMSIQIMELCKKAKRKYISDITTNGYLLSLDVFCRLLKLNVIEYQITVDGTKEIHDSKKPLFNGDGTFETVTDNIRKIKRNVKSSGFSVVIRSNVTDDALESMDSFTDFFFEMLGDDQRFSFFLRPAGDWGGENRLNEMKQKRISNDQISCVYKNFYNAGHPLRVDTHRSFYSPGGCMCYASFLNSYVIDTVGNIRKCTCELDDERYCIGQINLNGEMEIDYQKHSLWIGNTTRFSKKCDECNFSPACFGACCPKENILKNTGADDFEIICPNEKEQIFYTLKLIDQVTPFPYID